MKDEMILKFLSRADNEAFARSAAAAFVSRLDPTLEELADIKMAVSEAVTNSIVHGYARGIGWIKLSITIEADTATIMIVDEGCGIENVEQAMEPFFTTLPEEERSGMGFAVMQAFMDDVSVSSQKGVGTCVTMKKRIQAAGRAVLVNGKQRT